MATKTIALPDLGTTNAVDVIEITVKPGDSVKVGDALLTLEGDKASMEVPSPDGGVIESILVKIGDKVKSGDDVITMKVTADASANKTDAKHHPDSTQKLEEGSLTQRHTESKPPPVPPRDRASAFAVLNEDDGIYAGPGVRRMARELGVDLKRVVATGLKNRVLKEDVQQYVKAALISGSGVAVPDFPVVDFAQFGAIETKPLGKIKKLTGINLSRNWSAIPHVTQFIDADITELEVFRKSEQAQAEKEGVKLTVLVFLMKTVAAALKEFPQFNASLDNTGENLILKKYVHIGVAVDTPNGLVVPVFRDVDQKGLFELAKELATVSVKARANQLMPRDMQGSCFTISSLGGIGGRYFTPIVNWPDVAILGVSRSSMQPVYRENQFAPRLMLPLSLSYDHRVIDGADGARFAVCLERLLSDIRQVLL